jgi:hypothetical protein
MSEILRIHAKRNGRKIETISQEVVSSDAQPVSFDTAADVYIAQHKEDLDALARGTYIFK